MCDQRHFVVCKICEIEQMKCHAETYVRLTEWHYRHLKESTTELRPKRAYKQTHTSYTYYTTLYRYIVMIARNI